MLLSQLNDYIDNIKENNTNKECKEVLYTIIAFRKYSDSNYLENIKIIIKSYPQEKINFFDIVKGTELNYISSVNIETLKSVYLPIIMNRKTLLYLIDLLQKENDSLPSVYEVFFEYITDINSLLTDQMVDLTLKLLNPEKDIYIPFDFGLVMSKLTNKKIFCECEYRYTEFVCCLIQMLEDKSIELHITNSLEKPTFRNNENLRKFNSILAFPPRSLKRELNLQGDPFNRFNIHKGKILDVAHVEHILSQLSGIAVVVMPVGFSFRSGIEKDMRKFLVDKNLLKAQIQLPPNLYAGTSQETTIFILDRNKNTDDIYFRNLKHDKFLIKEGRQLMLKDIDSIVDSVYRRIEDDHGAIISNNEVSKNDYNLSIDKYILSKKVKEVNILLSKYELISLDNIAIVKKALTLKDDNGGEIVYELSPSDFLSCGFTTIGKKKKSIIVDSKFDKHFLKPFDILVSAKGVIGKVALIGENITPLLASQAIQIIRLKNNKNLKSEAIVLYMFLKSNLGQILLKEQLTQGTAMPQISTSEFKKFRIPLINDIKKLEVLSNFQIEIDKYDEINILQKEIDNINASFLN